MHVCLFNEIDYFFMINGSPVKILCSLQDTSRSEYNTICSNRSIVPLMDVVENFLSS